MEAVLIEYTEIVASELEKLAKELRDGGALLDEVKFEYASPSVYQIKATPICTASGRSPKNLEFSLEFQPKELFKC